MKSKKYELTQLKDQYKTLEGMVANMSDLASKIGKTIAKLSSNGSNNGKKYIDVHDYTHLDIVNMIEKGYSVEKICETLGAKPQEVKTINAHYEIGTYSTKKILNRVLTKTEKKNIYGDISKSKDDDYLADKYKIKIIRARGFLAAYNRP